MDITTNASSLLMQCSIQSKSLLQVVLMNDRISAAITMAILFSVDVYSVSPRGMITPRRIESVIIKRDPKEVFVALVWHNEKKALIFACASYLLAM